MEQNVMKTLKKEMLQLKQKGECDELNRITSELYALLNDLQYADGVIELAELFEFLKKENAASVAFWDDEFAIKENGVNTEDKIVVKHSFSQDEKIIRYKNISLKVITMRNLSLQENGKIPRSIGFGDKVYVYDEYGNAERLPEEQIRMALELIS